MLVEKFITYIRAEKRYSENTALNYERDVRRFTAFVEPRHGEGFSFAMVTSDDVREWVVELSKADKLAPASVNRMSSSVRAFFRWLRKTGLVTKDPFRGVGSQKMPSRLPSYITETQMDTLIGTLEQQSAADSLAVRRDSLIVLLLYSTGIRLAELAGIRLCDFSAGYRELKVRGKGGKERVVPVVGYTRDKIVDYLDTISGLNICISNDNSLFLTEKGKPVSRTEIYRIVRRELEAAGVQGKRSPHVLRHTFATHMLNDGADIREIQELMGHTSLAATQVYTHNSIEKLKQVYKNAHPRQAKKEGEEK